LLSWLEQRCADRQRRVVIGLTAPVGCGKSTLAGQLVQLARLLPLRLAVASIDDAYRPWAERRERLAGNPFGVNRVPPGSHDPAVLTAAIAAWREGGPLCLPRFDKRRNQGHGDRTAAITVAADALLLEGWLVGVEPMAEARLNGWLSSEVRDLSDAERHWLPRWNGALEDYRPLWACCDGFWVLQPDHWSRVVRWRLQAEARQRRQGQGAMTAREVRSLVRASLASLPPGLYHPALFKRAMAVATLDGRRRCLRVETGAQASVSSSLIG
jgi:D-glycerate 3-kinase